MSVSAAELPAMSSATGSEAEIARALRGRLEGGLRRIAYFVVPSAAAFLAFGGVIAGALFQTGRFTAEDSTFVWAILAGSSVGLLAATLGRLYSSAYYALRDTRTPLRYAMLRVFLTMVLGYFCAIPLPGILGVEQRWGAAGLTASAGLAGWVEFVLLQRGLERRISAQGISIGYLARLWVSAIGGAAAGFGVYLVTPDLGPILRAIVVLTPFGAGYLALTLAFGLPEAKSLTAAIRRRRG
jgi:putative peptidoglycan lipid II flippase